MISAFSGQGSRKYGVGIKSKWTFYREMRENAYNRVQVKPDHHRCKLARDSILPSLSFNLRLARTRGSPVHSARNFSFCLLCVLSSWWDVVVIEQFYLNFRKYLLCKYHTLCTPYLIDWGHTRLKFSTHFNFFFTCTRMKFWLSIMGNVAEFLARTVCFSTGSTVWRKFF